MSKNEHNIHIHANVQTIENEEILQCLVGPLLHFLEVDTKSKKLVIICTFIQTYIS